MDKVRIVPVYIAQGKQKRMVVDGYVVHPDDRVVRELPPPNGKKK